MLNIYFFKFNKHPSANPIAWTAFWHLFGADVEKVMDLVYIPRPSRKAVTKPTIQIFTFDYLILKILSWVSPNHWSRIEMEVLVSLD